MKKVLRILRNLILFFFISTILTVVIYRFIPVYFTPLMVIRSTQQIFKGEKPVWHHSWVSFDKISPHLPMAVIASEDNRFATHNGFDFIEIKKAMKENESGSEEPAPSASRQQKMYFFGPNLHGCEKDLKFTSPGLLNSVGRKNGSWKYILTLSKWEKVFMEQKLPPNTSSTPLLPN